MTVPLWGILAAALLLAGALLASLLLALGGDADDAARPSEASAPGAPTKAKATTPPELRGFTSEPTRKPFVVGGVRWAVFVDPQQSWTGFTRVAPPGAGRRWLLVSVRARNLARSGFDPQVLDYRVIDASGRAYFPDRRFGTGRRLNRAPRPLARKRVAQAELALRVPVGSSELRLLFDAGRGTRAPTQIPLDAP